MKTEFWFNRLIEYWTLPRAEEVVEHVIRGKVQVVQIGNFGPDFYSLADDSQVDRFTVGMPLVGIEENLEYAADLIPKIQSAGARVVGQLSSTLHYGDHLTRYGLFGDLWEQIWTPDLLGDPPTENLMHATSTEASGRLLRKNIKDRPYFSYRGCVSNPNWLNILKSMVRKGVDIGLDGFNTTHNYEGFCGCSFCADMIRAHMQDYFCDSDLDQLFD